MASSSPGLATTDDPDEFDQEIRVTSDSSLMAPTPNTDGDAILTEATKLRCDLHRFRGNVDACHQDSEKQLRDIERLEERVKEMRNQSIQARDSSFATANTTFGGQIDASNFANFMDDTTDSANFAGTGPSVKFFSQNDTNLSVVELELDNEKHRSANLETRISHLEDNLRTALSANASLSAELNNAKQMYKKEQQYMKQQERVFKEKMGELKRTFTLDHTLLLRLWNSIQHIRRNQDELKHGTNRDLTRFHSTITQARVTVDGVIRRSDLLKVTHAFENSPQLRQCLRRIMSERNLTTNSHLDELLHAVMQSVEKFTDSNGDQFAEFTGVPYAESLHYEEEKREWERRIAELTDKSADGNAKLTDLESAVARLAAIVADRPGRRSLSPNNMRTRSISPAGGSENVRAIRHALIQYKHDLDAADKQRDRMRAELENLRTALTKAELSAETANGRANEIEAVKLRLEKDLKVWPEKAESMVNDERRRHEARLSTLENQIDSLRSQLAERQNSLDAAKLELERLKADNEQLQRNNDKIERELTEESRKRQSMEQKWSRATDDLSAREMELRDFRDRCAEFSEKLDQMLTENRRLQNERDDFARQAEDSTKSQAGLHDQVENLQNQLEKLKEKYDAATGSVHQLTETNRQLSAEMQSRINELTLLQDESSEQSQNARRALSQLEEAKNTIETLEKRVQSGQGEVEQEKHFSEQLRAEWSNKLDESQKQVQKLWDSFTKAQNERKAIEDECSRLREENSIVQTQMDQLQETLFEARSNAEHFEQEKTRLHEKITEIFSQFRRTDQIFGSQEFDLADGGFDSISQLLDSLRLQLDAAIRDKNEAILAKRQIHSELSDARRLHKTTENDLHTTESRLVSIEETKSALENRFSNVQKTVQMQLDEIRASKDEVRVLKGKLKHLEVQGGAKDAKIKQLLESDTRVRAELDQLRYQMSSLLESEEMVTAEKAQALLDVQQLTEERDNVKRMLEQVRMECKAAQTAKSECVTRLKSMEEELSDLRLELDRTKRTLDAKSSEGAELRARLSHKTEADSLMSKLRSENDKLSAELAESNAAQLRLRSALGIKEKELSESEYELEEFRTNAISLEADLASARAKCKEREGNVKVLEQTVSSLRAQLAELSSNEHAHLRELSELRKSVERLSAELKAAQQQCDDLRATVQRLQRERRTMHSKIEALEKHQSILQSELSKTSNDRAAIDRGFSQLEEENRDKQKHIHELTAQIADLEHEHARRLLELSKSSGGARQQSAAMGIEVANVRRQLATERADFERRLSQMKSELSDLRTKLHLEQNRRVDYLKRLNASDRGIHEQHQNLSHSLKSFDRDIILGSKMAHSAVPYAESELQFNEFDETDSRAKSTGGKIKTVKRTVRTTNHAVRSLNKQLDDITAEPLASSTPNKSGVSFDTEPRVTPNRRDL